MRRNFLFFFVVALTSMFAHGASFDCRKADTNTEKLICSSEELSLLDDRLSIEYTKAQSWACDGTSLKQDQLAWLKRRNAEINESALAKIYKQRVEWLTEKNFLRKIFRAVVNRKLGAFQFVLESKGCHEYRAYHHQTYDLHVRNEKGQAIQRIEISSSTSPEKSFWFVDMDSDGYQDIVVSGGYGAGPFPNISLYRFNREGGFFQEDSEFPGGEAWATPAEDRGCVYVEERQPTGAGYDYVVTRWCLSPNTGTWAERQSCSARNDKECFDQIANYSKEWYKKHSRPNE